MYNLGVWKWDIPLQRGNFNEGYASELIGLGVPDSQTHP